MADLIRIRASNGDTGLSWSFVDEGMSMVGIELDYPPIEQIASGDVWQVQLVNMKKVRGTQRIATVRLIAKVLAEKAWMSVTELDDHWIEPVKLRAILTWLGTGTDIILIGPKGSGKTSLPFAITRTLGWQDPLKVDVYTIRKTTDLFGIEAAESGSTVYRGSSLMIYIQRAISALEQGLETQFIVIFDEINRVHATSNESLHGLFDDTRQITINTTEGSKIIKLPPNLHAIGTMNVGSDYVGTHALDEALKDRFAAVPVSPMPFDYEVARLSKETGITEENASKIVRVAIGLRKVSESGELTHSPSYRKCRDVARLSLHGMDLKNASIMGFLGWFDGSLEFDATGQLTNPDSETGKAYSALKIGGAVQALSPPNTHRKKR